jgi:hypothetical protein
MTRGINVAQPTKHQQANNRMKVSLEEVARSLERELGLLAEERKDRARRLGIEAGLVSLEKGK